MRPDTKNRKISVALPNGKALVRVDFERNEVIVHGR